jgi:cell wall-associated NlpC family hydrolase
VAFRLSRRARSVSLTVAALMATLTLLPAVAGAVPHRPATVDSVQKQLSALAVKNSQLVEKFDRSQTDVRDRQLAATKAERLASVAARKLAQAHVQLSASAVAAYEGGSFSATGALLSSESGSSYLDKLDTLSMLSAHSAQMVTDVAAATKVVRSARDHANALLTSATATRDALAKQRTTIQQEIGKYKALLAKLTAQQRKAFEVATNPKATPTQISAVATKLRSNVSSGAAGKAVQFALAQVGKPYVFGAAGPGSYDCSGLTMSAWQAGGVSLPHSAAGQYGYGTHVSASQLQPGDLLFYYSPIGHVTIYIGNGLMVSAPTEGENVMVVPVSQFTSDFVGATHLG